MTEVNARIPSSPPLIKPVKPGVARPKWSVMIPAYNCSNYLIRAMTHVLEQAGTPEEMQIMVVDDTSTDADVRQLVLDIGKGRIGYFRQEFNVGSLRNFETCLNLSTGHLIHILHGDDFIKEGFYQEIGNLFADFPEAGAAITESCYVNEDDETIWHHSKISHRRGILQNWLERIGQNQLIQTPSVVVRRKVYEHLGGFFGVHYGEDWEMWIRIAAHYQVAYSPNVLACYRVHQQNISSQYFLKGQCILDIAQVIETVKPYFPPEKRWRINRRARRNFSEYFARMTDRVYHDYHSPDSALMIAKKAFRMQFNGFTAFYLLKVRFKRLIRYKV